MKAAGFTLKLTVEVNGWSLDLSDATDAALYALAHSPVVRRWAEYPTPMRDAWRSRFGSGWAAQLMLPPALEPLEPELLPAPEADQHGPQPERDVRPPDVPAPPLLPPAGALGQTVPRRPRPTDRKRPAPAGGMPF